jgi:fluoride exporter
MPLLKECLVVAGGGALGCCLRYLLQVIFSWQHQITAFFVPTLIANIIGCFFIGILASLFETKQLSSPELRLFLIVGALGGLTTFSSFSWDTWQLLRNQQLLLAFAYIAAQLLLGLAATYLGIKLCR